MLLVGYPYVDIHSNVIERELLMGASKEQYEPLAEIDAKRMDMMDAYIGIGCNDNTSEMADVPSDKLAVFQSIIQIQYIWMYA